MPIKVVLQSERGEALDSVLDNYGDLASILPFEDATFPLLQFLDQYGNTIFNRNQMAQLMRELNSLVEKSKKDEQKLLLHRIEELAKRCWDGIGLYLKFQGD
jgi:hypothetical protein